MLSEARRIDSEDVLTSLLEATREGVLVVDDDLRVFASNLAAERAFAKSGLQLNGQHVPDLILQADIAGAFHAACSEDKTADIHLEYKSRVAREYDVHIAPIELGGRRRAIGFFYDVTQVHRLETIRQEFLSNISHELRTPLTSILAFVETLENGALEDPENNRHFLSVIRRNGERMRNLIADILELSQIESGNIVLDRKSVKLAPLVSDILTSLSSMAATREVILTNEVSASSIVHADEARLEQMLTNLVDNAIRFNRHGGAVTVADKPGAKTHQIFVSDTGEGIVADQIHRIFERFYRVDRARSRDVGGTGLGLAIVKHLARLHDGEVAVESELGVGTRFAVDLPAEPAIERDAR